MCVWACVVCMRVRRRLNRSHNELLELQLVLERAGEAAESCWPCSWVRVSGVCVAGHGV